MTQFMDDSEGASRAAVKRLTGQIYTQLVEATINAPDWYFPAILCHVSLLIFGQGYTLCRSDGSRSSMGS